MTEREIEKAKVLSKARREFTAKIVADMGKTIYAVGLASYFFERFPFSMKIILGIACVCFLVGSIFIEPRVKGGEPT